MTMEKTTAEQINTDVIAAEEKSEPGENVTGKPSIEKIVVNALSIAGMIATVAYIIYLWHEGILTSTDKMNEYINGFGLAGPVIFVIIQIVQVVIPIIPGAISCVFGVAAFGVVKGFIYNYVGICIGSVIVFLLAKKYGRPLMNKVFSQKLIAKYDNWTDENHRFTKLFAGAIFFPVSPDDFLCYLAGTTKMRLSTFILIILFGKPLSIIIYSWGLDIVIKKIISFIH